MFESLVVVVHHLGFQRLVHTFLILTLLLLVDSSILRNCGCPFHASLQLAFRTSVVLAGCCCSSKDSFTVRILFFNSAVLPPRLLLNFSLPYFDTHLLSLKPLAIGHQLFLRNSESLFKLSLCFQGNSSHLSIALQSFQSRLRHFLFSLHFELLVLYGLARFLLFSVFDVFLVYSSLTLCWMCRSSVCFMCPSRPAFDFSQVFLFFFCLLLALLFRFFSSFLTCCWVRSCGSPELLTY